MSYLQFKRRLRLIEGRLNEGPGSGVRLNSNDSIRIIFSVEFTQIGWVEPKAIFNPSGYSIDGSSSLSFDGYEVSIDDINGRILDWSVIVPPIDKELSDFILNENIFKYIDRYDKEYKLSYFIKEIANRTNGNREELKESLQSKMDMLEEENATFRDFMETFRDVNLKLDFVLHVSIDSIISGGWSRSEYEKGDVVVNQWIDDIDEVEMTVNFKHKNMSDYDKFFEGLGYLFDTNKFNNLKVVGKATDSFVEMWDNIFRADGDIDDNDYELWK